MFSSKKSDNYQVEFLVNESNQDPVSNSSHNSFPGSIIRPLLSLRKLFFDRNPLAFKTFESIQLQPIRGNLVSSLNWGTPERWQLPKNPNFLQFHVFIETILLAAPPNETI
ncbi:hypothetical protein CDAR_74311 [Caerostris darwini]|uniref:Uncharacterized protein n=1 Tax=Caerostris darwini TaxID=1538125 RepID=A0AAV4UJP5_9ARAC|nr:hypothetical protein CDAR_74311 [Caerostris darwini]